MPIYDRKATPPKPPLVSHVLDGLLYISFLSLLTVALSLSSCQAEVEKRMGEWLLGHGRMRPQGEDSVLGYSSKERKKTFSNT